MRQRRVKMMTLYLMCSGTSSQWRLSSISCVKPRQLPRTSQNAGLGAAALITVCSLLVMTFGARRERHYNSPPVMLQRRGWIRRRLRGEHLPNMSESTKMVEASRTNVKQVRMQTKSVLDEGKTMCQRETMWVQCVASRQGVTVTRFPPFCQAAPRTARSRRESCCSKWTWTSGLSTSHHVARITYTVLNHALSHHIPRQKQRQVWESSSGTTTDHSRLRWKFTFTVVR